MKLISLLIFLSAATVSAQQEPPAPATATEAKTEEEKKKDAAEADPNQAPPELQKDLERIVVTGSYLRQAIGQKAPTPVSIVDNAKMTETGSFTVADALQENVAFNFVDGGAFVNMHGQSEADNLVLLNGVRLPKTAGSTGVNIDFLPVTAIERVEILKDGASALYGSEALAGVVNIITKKNYDGVNFIARHTYPEIGADQESTVGITYGKTWGKNNFLGVFQYRKEEPAFLTDTQYGIKDSTIAGNLFSSPGNVLDPATGFYRDPNCPATQLDAGGRCRLKRTDYQQITAGQDKDYYTGYLSYGLQASKAFNFEVLAIYTRRHWTAQSYPRSIDMQDQTATGGPDFSIPAANANAWGTVNSGSGAPSAFGNNVNLMYAAAEELGPAISVRDVDSFVEQARLNGQIDKWEWDLSAGHGLTFFADTTIRGEANKQAIFDRLISGDFNPFKPSGAKDNLAPAAIQPWFKHTSDNIDAKYVMSGPVADIGGPLSMAIGAEAQWQSFKFENDPFSLAGLTLAGAASDQSGKRDVLSTFVELGYSPIKKLDLQVAGRFDKYSDVGSTVNPKFGAAYHLTEQITFRTSYGTGFKAPDLLSVFQGTETTQTRVRDEVICANNGEADPNCDSGIYPVTTLGNRNLDPETAIHYNVGVVVTPKNNLVVAVDYWNVQGEDALSEVDPDLVTRAEQLGLIGLLNQAGVVVNRPGGPGTPISSIITPVRVNAGRFKIQGLDAHIEKQLMINPYEWGAINVRLEMDHSHVLRAGGQDFSFDPFRRGYNLDWKNVIAVSFAKGNHFTKFGVRTYAGHDKDTSINGIGEGQTPTFSEIDVHYEFTLTESSTISSGIKNLFDRTPTSYVRGSLNPADTDTNFLGRTYYLGYSVDF